MKGKLFKRLCAMSLSAMMLLTPGAVAAGTMAGTSIPVYATTYETADGLITYEIDKNGEITVTTVRDDATILNIPSKIDGKTVTKIGSGAASYCWSLSSVTLPTTLTSIGNNAFDNCLSLKTIIIPSKVKTIGEKAFHACLNMTSFTVSQGNQSFAAVNGALYNKAKDTLICFPAGKKGSVTIPSGVTKITEYAFEQCMELTDVTLPKGLQTIGDWAFASCDKLTKVVIPDSVTSVGSHVFAYSDLLKEAAVPAKATSIGAGAYIGPNKLTKAHIPGTVSVIGEEAFKWDYELSDLTIQHGVTTIEKEAFLECKSLKSVIIPSSVKTIGADAFKGCPDLVIKGYKGSRALSYAKENNIPYEVMVPLKNTSTLSADNVKIGSTIKINCASTGGQKPITYKVLFKSDEKNYWSRLQDFSTNATVNFKPRAAVKYTIRVIAKGTNGKTVTKDMDLNVFEPLENTSSLSAKVIELGESVKINCSSTGGVAPVQYSVLFKSSVRNWTKLRDYGSFSSVSLKPLAGTKYTIRVKAKDERGVVIVKDMELNVIGPAPSY